MVMAAHSFLPNRQENSQTVGKCSIQFATFHIFIVLKATNLKHFWVEGFETQVPFTLGQAQQSGS